MKAMETIDDLIQEAKVRTVWWALCIFFVTYFLTQASNSMWMNMPMAVLILCGLRILLNQNEFRSKGMPDPRQSHLYYPGRKQLSLNDARLSTIPPRPRSKKKINSPVVEAAINDFVDKIIDNYVKNLWYSSITPDKEFPELIRGVIMNALGEISVRVKEINIVDLIRDIVDLIGDHLESFRRSQAAIGTDVMKTLSPEKRDEKLRCHLMASKELYPALRSKESEYKVLQKIVAGILSMVLRRRESQCPLVQTIARELLTCLVVQPLVDFASAERINVWTKQFSREEQSVKHASSSASDNQAKSINLTKVNEQETPSVDDESHPEVATQRRTEALHKESQHCQKLKFRVLGGCFEKLSSKSFAIYSIAVIDTENKSWFIKRRYTNFERLHSQFKENPNYNLLLPPKPIFSSSTEDAFVHRHCIQLDKYLQDLLSIASVAEQNEVWDFLSESSKNYSPGESSPWMPTNVISVPILNLVDKVFQLNRGCWLRRQSFEVSKHLFVLTMEGAVDDWLLRGIYSLRNEDTVAHGIRLAQDILWSNGVDHDGEEALLDQTDPSEETFQMAGQLGGEKVVKPSSFEQLLAAGASKFKKFLLDDAPKALVRFVRQNLHRTCPRDTLYFTQSNVCIKQLAFAILELLIRTIFPELQHLLRDIRENHLHGRSK